MNRPSVPSRRLSGFTLIELLIVLVVLSIIVSIAIPAYRDQVQRTRRADAKAELAELTQALERWHTVRRTYVGFAVPAGISDEFYEFDVDDLSAMTYTLTAAPQGDQADDDCGTLGINQAGVRTVTSGEVDRCWER